MQSGRIYSLFVHIRVIPSLLYMIDDSAISRTWIFHRSNCTRAAISICTTQVSWIQRKSMTTWRSYYQNIWYCYAVHINELIALWSILIIRFSRSRHSGDQSFKGIVKLLINSVITFIKNLTHWIILTVASTGFNYFMGIVLRDTSKFYFVEATRQYLIFYLFFAIDFSYS